MINYGFQFGVGMALSTPLIFATICLSDYLLTLIVEKYENYKRKKNQRNGR